MAKVRIVGPRGDLGRTLTELYHAEAIELSSVHGAEQGLRVGALREDERGGQRTQQLREQLSELDHLLRLARKEAHIVPAQRQTSPSKTGAGHLDARASDDDLARAAAEIRGRVRAVQQLRDTHLALDRHLEPLTHAIPLWERLGDLGSADLAALSIDVAVLVLDTPNEALVWSVRERLAERLGSRFEFVFERVSPRAVACVLVSPQAEATVIAELLVHEHIRHAEIPERFQRLSLPDALAAMTVRRDELHHEVEAAQSDLRTMLDARVDGWIIARDDVRAELAQIAARSYAEVTARAFVLDGWVPEASVAVVQAQLERELGPRVAVERLCPAGEDAPPVALSNPRVARPFETLVRLFELPQPGTLDPTVLLALFLPLMFGVMVGDVIYGAALLGIALWMLKRFQHRSALLFDVAKILALGSLWAIVFGFLFGEALGNFGHKYLHLGPVWFYRAGEHAIEPLFLLALGLGGAHVVLGLMLGIRQAARDRDRRELIGRSATLVVIVGCVVLAAVAMEVVHPLVTVPAVIAMLSGLLALSVVNGAMGAVIGPVELIGALANVLSYLRLAAVGLASAYLANVANEFAVTLPLAIGLLVAAFLHVLNLTLAAFSPMLQSVRLSYVEFFSKFYKGGGRAFAPFGADFAPVSESVAIQPGRA